MIEQAFEDENHDAPASGPNSVQGGDAARRAHLAAQSKRISDNWERILEAVPENNRRYALEMAEKLRRDPRNAAIAARRLWADHIRRIETEAAEADGVPFGARKRCSRCEQVLPAEDFTADRHGRFGRNSQCRACAAEVRRQKREATR